MARDYRKEYDEYHAKPEQKKRRAARNAARRKAVREGRVAAGDSSREVHHPSSSRTGSLGKKTAVISKTRNRKDQPKRS